MKTKSEGEKIFKDFYKLIENQFQTKISILRNDNRKEYLIGMLEIFN